MVQGNVFMNRFTRVGVAVLYLLSGITSIANADENSETPPGLMVDIGTHRMHILCKGERQPTVIMDAGLGGVSLEWVHVQDLLQDRVRVCAYDRTGYGWSDAGPMPRTSSRNANELFLLLQQARIPGPYVLVGHSYGGYNMQLFARRHQDITAALVLVDASHPDQLARFEAPPIGINMMPDNRGTMMGHLMPTVATNLPEELKPIAHRQLLNPKTRVAAGSEYLNFRKSAAQVREERPLPGLPVVVVTRGKRAWPETKLGDRMEQLWLDLQAELAAASPRSAHIIAEKSGHHVHLDQPELVADAITLVIEVTINCCQLPPGGLLITSRENKTIQYPFNNATWRSNHLGNLSPADLPAFVWF